MVAVGSLLKLLVVPPNSSNSTACGEVRGEARAYTIDGPEDIRR